MQSVRIICANNAILDTTFLLQLFVTLVYQTVQNASVAVLAKPAVMDTTLMGVSAHLVMRTAKYAQYLRLCRFSVLFVLLVLQPWEQLA